MSIFHHCIQPHTNSWFKPYLKGNFVQLFTKLFLRVMKLNKTKNIENEPSKVLFRLKWRDCARSFSPCGEMLHQTKPNILQTQSSIILPFISLIASWNHIISTMWSHTLSMMCDHHFHNVGPQHFHHVCFSPFFPILTFWPFPPKQAWARLGLVRDWLKKLQK